MHVTPLIRRIGTLGLILGGGCWAKGSAGGDLNYLHESDPFYVDRTFPKLTTPQWVGEDGVEAVVVLAIDDMTDTATFENYLRPILDRLKQIDGRAPVSIMTNRIDVTDPHLLTWLDEGLTIEVHTLDHPCPLLQENDLETAIATYQGCVDLLGQIPGNEPVAYRMPCCDSLNTTSPRFLNDIFGRPSPEGRVLSIDSSVVQVFSADDPLLPRELVLETDGMDRFWKYLPFPAFSTTVENYPYPFVIGQTGWEFPCTVPSDWEAQNLHGDNEPKTVEDWKAALDATVLKQGVFTMVFHTWGWITSEQIVELIDYAEETYGDKVKFLNFKEALERLNQNMLRDVPLRGLRGQDNGVRMVDLNQDGYLDVVSGNATAPFTRVWQPEKQQWMDYAMPISLVSASGDGSTTDTGVQFGQPTDSGEVVMLVRSEVESGAWKFTSTGGWVAVPELWQGLDGAEGELFTRRDGVDQGVRLRDIDGDGRSEMLVGNPTQSAAWSWQGQAWESLPYALPPSTMIVDEAGRDAGLRFVDLNEDGLDDLVFSNASEYSIHLYVAEDFLWFKQGWGREVMAGQAGAEGAIPMIVRGGEYADNGAWFHSQHMWVQNEDTAHMPDLVDRRSFQELMVGHQPGALEPEAALKTFQLRDGFGIELVAAEPEIMDPVAFEWGEDGALWVVQMQDYPLGVDGNGSPGGTIKRLTDEDGDGRYETATSFLEGLHHPTGVMPWGKGVLVSAAPEIIYAEDTDGDGRADRREVLFQGFVEGNQQHRFNGFEYGLDNWIYGANGDSGGVVKWNGAAATEVDIRGSDFRFRPDTGEFEAVEGQTQFGRRRDDWGNWFGNNNPAWGWHYVFPSRYLARNPFLAVKSTKRELAQYEEGTRVYYTSPLLQRFNEHRPVDHVTSANSPTPYRDDWFGPDFASSVFVSEPVYNVIHREVLSPDGVSFSSRRAAGEEQQEFLASSDPWFRPTTMRTGPDGALYISDMYRFVIEHPEWIPADTQKNLDLRAGSDRGRIYRVFPLNEARRPMVTLKGLESKALAGEIESSNGWVRDTVQRLLVAAKDPQTIPVLEVIVSTSSRPQVRVQALATLDGMGALRAELLIMGMEDADARVRREAVRMSEGFMADAEQGLDLDIIRALEARVDDPDESVRLQLAFSLGEWDSPIAAAILARLAEVSWDSADLQIGVLSSLPTHVDALAKLEANLFEPLALAVLAYQQQVALRADAVAMEVVKATPVNEPRADYASVVASFQTIDDLTGDVTAGARLFAPLCGQCHQYRGQGALVGPSMDTLGETTTEFLLQAILDPNAAVEEKFTEVIVTKSDDTMLSGILAEETETTATLRIMGGYEQVLLKAEITRMEFTGRSLMPEGLETGYDAQGMADLLAFLRVSE